MDTFNCSLEGMQELKYEHPERTAYKVGYGLFPDCIFRVFPNRQAMAKCIRLQQRREPSGHDWKAVIPLSETEGY